MLVMITLFSVMMAGTLYILLAGKNSMAVATLCLVLIGVFAIAGSWDAFAVERPPVQPAPVKPPVKQIPNLPDLAIRAGSISTIPSPPLAGAPEIGNTTFQAEVQNLGSAEARNFAVAFVFKSPDGALIKMTSVTVASLAAHSSKMVSMSQRADSLPPAGTYRLAVMADIYPTSVTESNERNNGIEQSIVINGPDFAVSSSDIEVSPVALSPGAMFTARAPIRNIGTGRGLLGTRIRLLDSSGRVLDEKFVGNEISAGGFVFVSAQFTLPAGYGDYVVRFEADYNNRNPEPDKENNQAEKYISVRSVR